MTITEAARHLDAERFVGSAMEPKGITIDPPVRVPTERYLSPEFAALEPELLWPRVWHVACTRRPRRRARRLLRVPRSDGYSC